MVNSVEGAQAPIQNKNMLSPEIRRLDSYSPQALGWVPSTPWTGILESPLDLRVKHGTYEEGDVFYCAFPPVKGEMLIKMLATATSTPEQQPKISMIQADWEIYENAKAAAEKGGVDTYWQDLLQQHVGDPIIGRMMIAFGEGYVDRWTSALLDTNNILQTVFRPFEVVDMHHFPAQYLQEMATTESGRERFIYSSGTNRQHESLVREYRKESGLQRDYSYQLYPLIDQEEFTTYAAWLGEKHPRTRDSMVASLVEQAGISLIDIGGYEANEKPPWWYLAYARETVHEGDTITLTERTPWKDASDLVRARLKLQPTGDLARPYTVTSLDVTVPAGEQATAITPAVAWRQTPDGRTFLTREEMIHLFGGEGQNVDDLLGKVALTGFQASNYASVAPQMHLREEGAQAKARGGNDLGPAQIGVFWLKNQDKIALDRDGVLGSIETYAGEVQREDVLVAEVDAYSFDDVAEDLAVDVEESAAEEHRSEDYGRRRGDSYID